MNASESVEARLRAIEDRLAIYQIIASHPPSADSAADYYTRTAYVEDGSMDLGGGKGAQGNGNIAAITKTPEHQAAMAGGLAHFASLPHVTIDGDTAVATSYLQILMPHPTAEPMELSGHGVTRGFRIHRVGANRWELRRTADGWKIVRRTLRALDGSQPARDLLAAALAAHQPSK